MKSVALPWLVLCLVPSVVVAAGKSVTLRTTILGTVIRMVKEGDQLKPVYSTFTGETETVDLAFKEVKGNKGETLPWNNRLVKKAMLDGQTVEIAIHVTKYPDDSETGRWSFQVFSARDDREFDDWLSLTVDTTKNLRITATGQKQVIEPNKKYLIPGITIEVSPKSDEVGEAVPQYIRPVPQNRIEVSPKSDEFYENVPSYIRDPLPGQGIKKPGRPRRPSY